MPKKSLRVLLSSLAAPLLLGLACLFASSASAHYREACWIKFWKFGDEWSATFAVTCQYATGQELNAEHRTKRFDSYKAYAILSVQGGAPITVRIDQPLSCGFVAEDGCAEQTGHLLTGLDEHARYRHGHWLKRKWKICQPGIMGVCEASSFYQAR